MFLKEFRVRENMTQNEIAEKIGVSRVIIEQCETKQIQPTANMILMYIKRLDANPAFLYKGIDPLKISDMPDSMSESYSKLNNMKKFLSEKDIQKKIEDSYYEETLSRFMPNRNSKSKICKVLVSLRMERHLRHSSMLFLYYLFHNIAKSKKHDRIISSKGYLLHKVIMFKTPSLLGTSLFVSPIRKRITHEIEYEMSESECAFLINNIKRTIEKIKERIPRNIVIRHKRVAKKA